MLVQRMHNNVLLSDMKWVVGGYVGHSSVYEQYIQSVHIAPSHPSIVYNLRNKLPI